MKFHLRSPWYFNHPNSWTGVEIGDTYPCASIGVHLPRIYPRSAHQTNQAALFHVAHLSKKHQQCVFDCNESTDGKTSVPRFHSRPVIAQYNLFAMRHHNWSHQKCKNCNILNILNKSQHRPMCLSNSSASVGQESTSPLVNTCRSKSGPHFIWVQSASFSGKKTLKRDIWKFALRATFAVGGN